MEGKLPGIQVGRAVAAASVFYFHSYIGMTYFDQANLRPFRWLAANGASGVDLFFAISGFIVCYVAAAPDFTPATFLWKRFCRIFPLNAVVTVVIVLFTVNVSRITDDPGWLHVVQSILILPQKVPVNSVGWTLEYEVVFYIIAAILLPLGGPRALLGYCAASYLIAAWLNPETPVIARFISDHHAAFGAGVLAYIVARRIPSLKAPSAWTISILLPVMALIIFRLGTVMPIPLRTPTACGLAVLGLAFLPWAPQWLVKFGDISYGFYLLHWPGISMMTWEAFARITPNPVAGEVWRWETFLHITLVAYLSWTYFEHPINRWARSASRRYFRAAVHDPAGTVDLVDVPASGLGSR
jgi:exopolysaccharide production protein ExoZ